MCLGRFEVSLVSVVFMEWKGSNPYSKSILLKMFLLLVIHVRICEHLKRCSVLSVLRMSL